MRPLRADGPAEVASRDMSRRGILEPRNVRRGQIDARRRMGQPLRGAGILRSAL